MKTEYRDSLKWFWDLLQEANASLEKLESWMMETATEGELTLFAGLHRYASDWVEDCLKYYPEGGDYSWVLSEDGMMDLGAWVVEQGHGYWSRVVKNEYGLKEATQDHLSEAETSTDGKPLLKWNSRVAHAENRGYQAPRMLAERILEKRFGYVDPDDSMDLAQETMQAENLWEPWWD